MRGRSVAALILLGTTLCVGEVQTREHLARALYWNTPPYGAMSAAAMDAAIAELTARHIDRVHLWLNDQPTSSMICTDTFQYVGWSEATLEAFASRLKAAGLGVVLTLSPSAPTESYIASLSGPLALAKRTGADVEFDLEGNWTTHFGPQNCGPLGQPPNLPELERRMLEVSRATAPGVQIGVSIQPRYYESHKVIVQGADWVSPQLYEMSVDTMRASLDKLENIYSVKALWPAVRVDTTLEKFIPAAKGAAGFAENDPKVRGVAFWGRNELTYVDRWLTQKP